MDRETARQECKREWRKIIPAITSKAPRKVNGEDSYKCPLCPHGSTGDGLTFDPNSRSYSLHCFGCGFTGDIIDLTQRVTDKDYSAALEYCAAQIGITVDKYIPAPGHSKIKFNAPERRINDFMGETNMEQREDIKTQQNAPQSVTRDFTEYYRICAERLTDPEAVSYLTGRGISVETAAKYGVGFDPVADPANAPGAIGDEYKPHPVSRIILPANSGFYVGRSIVDDERVKGEKVSKDGKPVKYDYRKSNPKGANVGTFNENALYAPDVQEVFVTEGAFDALSLLEIGMPAIALNSTSNARMLLEKLEKKRTKATLILCLDADKSGKGATEILRQGLKRINISYSVVKFDGHKDANEALTADREAFTRAAQQAKRMAAKPDNIADYIDRFMTDEIARFKEVKYTGFENLDKESGGLYSGLYTVAAISSLGKTTFCHQIADQLAAAGNDVLFFSLEQSKLELVSKSIARKTAQANMDTAVTSLSIRRGYLPAQVLAAADQYKAEVQDRMSIVEGNFACNISFIGDYIRNYINKTGKRPVVFIDYLQILQPEQSGNRQQTVRETVDSSITELKRISRELDLTVFVICSVNRSNYLTPVDFESLKESGGIEYTCDVIWGLQLQCLNDEVFDRDSKIKEKREKVRQAKAATPRKIELVCLKNRYGKPTFSCYFNYYAANDLFTQGSPEEFESTTAQPKPGRRV